MWPFPSQSKAVLMNITPQDAIFINLRLAMLGGVIGLAMVTNILIAGLAGVLIPLTLDRLEADPAISSSVFVTMITDSMGFFVFLGLATLSGLVG